MSRKFRNENTDFLIDCIMQIKDKEECYNFFQDLCTVTEFHAMAQRCVVAKMLSDKSVYAEIVERTGASTATISRVNRSLQDGADGYDTVFSRLEK